MFLMFFHEPLICPPGHSGRLYRIPLRAHCYLMRVKIMQPQLVEQRLLNDLMREEERLDAHRAHQPAKAARQMPIDKDRMSVYAVAGNVRDIIIAVDYADAAA